MNGFGICLRGVGFLTEYLVFKLNLQPAKLIEYKNDKSYLIEELIPSMLEHIVALEKLKGKEVYKISLEDKDEKQFKVAYDRLLSNTDNLLKLSSIR